jgi:hypothetical protein
LYKNFVVISSLFIADVDAAGGLTVHGLYREGEPKYKLFGSVNTNKTDSPFFDLIR